MPGPIKRKKTTTGTSEGVKKRGEGLGTGPVGNNSSGAQHAAQGSGQGTGSSGSKPAGGNQLGGKEERPLGSLLGGSSGGSQGGLLGSLLGGGSSQSSNQQSQGSILGDLLGGGQSSNQQQNQGSSLGSGLFGGSQSSGQQSQGSGLGGLSQGGGSGQSGRRSGCLGSLLGSKGMLIILVIIVAFFVLKGGLFSGNGGSETPDLPVSTTQSQNVPATTAAPTTQSAVISEDPNASAYASYGGSGGSIGDIMAMLFGGGASGGQSSTAPSGYNSEVYANNWTSSGTTESELNNNVVTGVPAKRTQIYGDSRDMINLMVYMCGTDLESKSGAATQDLQEMLAAEVGDNINLIIYTGGCAKWNNNVISNKVNQIYQVKGGKLYSLNENAGNGAMTNPDTLSGFVKWVGANFPANRNMLIFWDHGGGSVSGYGYDEKYKSSGSMSLAGIDKALKNSGMVFDVVGFDACLMATVETALMLGDYADYMIASEEVEPGIGWYYTDWLTKLSRNPSMPTLELGKNIVDTFTQKAARVSYGTGTTLSVVDLAEACYTIPDKMTAFAASTINIIESGSTNSSYKTVANARANAKEFGSSSKIDQVDFVDLAQKMGTPESKALAEAMKGAIKYNVTSGSMSNAYGLAVYFPYRKASYVDPATKVYNQSGVPSKYSECIKKFAQLEVGGQVASGGTGFPIESLLGGLGGSSSGGSSAGSIMDLLGGFLGGDTGSIFGLDRSNIEFMQDMDVQAVAEFVAENNFDQDTLLWTKNDAGDPVIALTAEDWLMLEDIKFSMFYDDGEGFVDLGLDAYYDYDKQGNLLPTELSWLAINGQTVAYYQDDSVGTEEDYVITGHVPVLYNGELAELVIVFTKENPDGIVAGVRFNYKEDENETLAKYSNVTVENENAGMTTELYDAAGKKIGDFGAEADLTALQKGDTIDFIADYYTHEGKYVDTYKIGNQITVDGALTITNLALKKEDVRAMYRLTDIYNREYWTEVMP